MCVADCRWFECSADFFEWLCEWGQRSGVSLSRYRIALFVGLLFDGVGGQWSRSARVAFLWLLDGNVNGVSGQGSRSACIALLCMLDGSLNRVGGQGSRSARTSIALLCLLCVQVPKTPFQASSNNIGIVRWCGEG